MNRNELQDFSRHITQRYFGMLQALTAGTVTDPIQPDAAVGTFCYYRILELQQRWLSDETPLRELMSGIFIGMNAIGAPVSVVLSHSGKKLGLFVGTLPDHTDALEGMLRGVFPQVRLLENSHGNPVLRAFPGIVPENCAFGGFLKGNPVGSESLVSPRQIDSVIQGMQGSPWHFSVFAVPVSKRDTLERQQGWMTEVSRCSAVSALTVSESDGRETMNSRLSFPHSEQFLRKANAYLDRLAESVSSGEWRVTANFASDSENRAKMLGGLLVSAFFGKNAEPEPIHSVFFPSGQRAETLTDDRAYHRPLELSDFPAFTASCPPCSTYLSSRELGVLAAFPTVDTAGLAVTAPATFDAAREAAGSLSVGRILEGGHVTENDYSMNPNELNRHCLAVGLTGSGKTNTLKSILRFMTRSESLPFLVIEPAKKEYWSLYDLGYPDLQIYSVGSFEPGAHPFCLNPFERASYTDDAGEKHQVSLQTHIDFVFAAFKASFILYTPMPYVLEQAIYTIYEDYGWDVMENRNRFGREIYPTLEDLYHAIPKVVDQMDFDPRMRSDLIGSLQSRITSMRLGSKGRTLNVRKSFPMDQLLKGHVVIELEDIGDDDVKAFLISLLLISLLEIRRQEPDAQLELHHLLLIEEAHRLLKNIQSGTGENADPRGAAVEFFCNLLAELRSKGQGFIVADQVPSKLAPDLLKNTNLKIAHRTVEQSDRELIGGAMHMTPEQIEALACLQQGEAAVYSEGDHRPKLVKPPFAGLGAPERQSTRRSVLRAVAPNCYSAEDDPRYRYETNRQSALCRACDAACARKPGDLLAELDSESFRQLAERTNPRTHPGGTVKVSAIRGEILDLLRRAPCRFSIAPENAELCVLQCLYQSWNSSPKFQASFNAKYQKLREVNSHE